MYWKTEQNKKTSTYQTAELLRAKQYLENSSFPQKPSQRNNP